MPTGLHSTNQVKFSGMCRVMSVPFGMSHGSIVRAATGLAPVREPVALDRSKRPPRSVARQATFLGETEPRAARPLGASLRVRQLGAAGWGCQCERRPRLSAAPAGSPRDADWGSFCRDRFGWLLEPLWCKYD